MRRCGSSSGLFRKILLLSTLAVALVLALPVVVQAKSAEGGAEPAESAPATMEADAAQGTVAPGSWKDADLGGGDSQLATLPPEIDPWGWGTKSNWTVTGTWDLTTEWWSWSSGGASYYTWSDSPGGNYLNNTDSTLTYRSIDISTAADGQSVVFLFDCLVNLEYGKDFLLIEYSGDGGSTYTHFEYLTGSAAGFYYYVLPEDLVTDQFRVRFRLVTNGSVTADGVHLDNITLITSPTDYADQTDSRLAYVGSWSSVSSSTAEGGSYYTTTQTNAAVVVKFEGTALSCRFRLDPSYGKAEVLVDGANGGIIDLRLVRPVWFLRLRYFPGGRRAPHGGHQVPKRQDRHRLAHDLGRHPGSEHHSVSAG